MHDQGRRPGCPAYRPVRPGLRPTPLAIGRYAAASPGPAGPAGAWGKFAPRAARGALAIYRLTPQLHKYMFCWSTSLC